jgi:hypothetical protein
MTNPAGTRWETALARYLVERGHLTGMRRSKSGRVDKGDVFGVDDLTIQAKATRDIDLAKGVGQATLQAVNAGTRYFVAVFKARYKSVGDAYVATRLHNYLDLVEEVLQLRRENRRLRERLEWMAALLPARGREEDSVAPDMVGVLAESQPPLP